MFQDCVSNSSLHSHLKTKGLAFCIQTFKKELQSWATDPKRIFFYLERVRLTFLHSWSCEFKLDLVDCQVVKLCCVVAYIMELSLWIITWSLGRRTNFSKAIVKQMNSFIFTMHVLSTAKGGRGLLPKNPHEVCCKSDCSLQIHAKVKVKYHLVLEPTSGINLSTIWSCQWDDHHFNCMSAW